VKKVGKQIAPRSAMPCAQRRTTAGAGRLMTFDDKGDVTGGLIFVYQVKGPAFQQIKTVVVK
jgi:hypothetical protein